MADKAKILELCPDFHDYFSWEEFDSPDSADSHICMDTNFLIRLYKARKKSSKPFVISSGYRTPAHNERVGGVDNSSHTLGYAVDIRCSSSLARFEIITSLLEAGFTRIGVSGSFIHVDSDPTKPASCIWTY